MSITTKDATRVDAGLELIGSRIGKYEVVRIIGRGGMGRVYEAVNTAINKRVALKVIDHELAKDEDIHARFQREALAASAVESPYIVQIFDAGAAQDGAPYIVMELLRGADLGRLIHDKGRLAVPEVFNVTAQILKGLHHAHGAGIVHRDLKPDNVFLVERDDEPAAVKLLDFGVSKIANSKDVPLRTLTRQGTVVGTPFYMSPEQAQAFPDVDRRTDIYSVGAILYECLTGHPPHRGTSYEQVIVSICMKDAEDVRAHNPDVPKALAELIHKALSRERTDRFDDAKSMLEALIQAAPADLGTTPAPHLRISGEGAQTIRGGSAGGGGSTPTARVGSGGRGAGAMRTPDVISAPTPELAHELADTALSMDSPDLDLRPSDDPRRKSGISSKSARAIAAAKETVRREGDTLDVPVPTPKRGTLVLALAAAIIVFVVLFFALSERGDTAIEAEPVVAEPTETQVPSPNASRTREQRTEPDAPAGAVTTEPSVTASAIATTPSATPSAKRRPGSGAAMVKPQPAKSAATMTPPQHIDEPAPKKPGLEIMKR